MRKRLSLALLLLALAIGAALAGPYPGDLPDHGHTRSGDGGVLTNLSLTSTGRLTVGASTMTRTGFFIGSSSITSTQMSVNGATVTKSGFFIGSSSVTADGLVTGGINADVSAGNSGLFMSQSVSNSVYYAEFQNTSATAASVALYLNTPSSGTGDPFIWFRGFLNLSSNDWSVGVDRGDNGAFKIQNATSLTGTNNGSIRIDATNANVAVKGTPTNDDAPTGYVGEYSITFSTQASFLNTSVWGNLASITLPAGDWDITASYDATANGATVTDVLIGISTTTGNSTAGLILGWNRFATAGPTSNNHASLWVPAYRGSYSASTSVYLKYSADFSVATPFALGRISARRVR